MQIVKHTFYKVKRLEKTVIPIYAPPKIHFPSMDYDFWKPEYSGSFCGAGRGLGDKVVPETVWGLYVTLACYVHDQMWDQAKYSRYEFEQSNMVFFHNLCSIIFTQSKNQLLKHIRLYRAVTMYDAVDTLGWLIFKKLKEEQNEKV